MQDVTAASICPDCRASLPLTALSCSTCHYLVHAEQLEDFCRRAQIATNGHDFALAKSCWLKSLELLPADTLQYKSIQDRVSELDRHLAASPVSNSLWKKTTAGIGPVAVLLWKFKVVLLGLAKMGTLLSMFVSLGFYWSIYGWALGLGLILSIYIHEMGHVVALRSFGIPAGAPMFIPGLGAIIQLRGVSLPPIQDSRIGLAGPIYGFGAALFCLGAYLVTGHQMWAVIANIGAVINLFNLIPVWQLDGARGFHSLTRNQRAIILGLSLALWLLSSQPMLLLIAIGAVYQLFRKQNVVQQPDNTGFVQFAGLLIALTVIIALVPEK